MEVSLPMKFRVEKVFNRNKARYDVYVTTLNTGSKYNVVNPDQAEEFIASLLDLLGIDIPTNSVKNVTSKPHLDSEDPSETEIDMYLEEKVREVYKYAKECAEKERNEITFEKETAISVPSRKLVYDALRYICRLMESDLESYGSIREGVLDTAKHIAMGSDDEEVKSIFKDIAEGKLPDAVQSLCDYLKRKKSQQ